MTSSVSLERELLLAGLRPPRLLLSGAASSVTALRLRFFILAELDEFIILGFV